MGGDNKGQLKFIVAARGGKEKLGLSSEGAFMVGIAVDAMVNVCSIGMFVVCRYLQFSP